MLRPSRPADSSQNQESARAKRRAVQALKKDGIDADNLLYWRSVMHNGCASSQVFPLPQEDPAATARQIAREFGPIDRAFAPFSLVAEGAGVVGTVRLQGDDWEEFVKAFDLWKRWIERENGSAAATHREEFLAVVGGVVGQKARWQLWFADRFSSGLTLRSLLEAGRDAGRIMKEHWAETDAGGYATGSTRPIFGKSWQPKGWTTENRGAVEAFGRFVLALADGTASTETRASSAMAALEDFHREQRLSGAASRPEVCEPSARAGLLSILTPEDYHLYDKEDAPPQREHHGKKQGGSRMRGMGL